MGIVLVALVIAGTGHRRELEGAVVPVIVQGLWVRLVHHVHDHVGYLRTGRKILWDGCSAILQAYGKAMFMLGECERDDNNVQGW